jgi:hypothetical protein
MQVAETFAMELDASMQKELASRGLTLPAGGAAAAAAGGATATVHGGSGGGGKGGGKDSWAEGGKRSKYEGEGEAGSGGLSLSRFARLDT